MGKKVFSKVVLIHFFYVEANVRISYSGTLFETMVLKLQPLQLATAYDKCCGKCCGKTEIF